MSRFMNTVWIVALCLFLPGGLAIAQVGTPDSNGHEQTEVFRADKFTHPTNIDNKWTLMKPGTRWVYEGTSVEDDGKVVPHRIVVTVTDLYQGSGRDWLGCLVQPGPERRRSGGSRVGILCAG